MILYTNENILNLIIDSLSLSKTKEILNRVNNRILNQLLVRQITYFKIFQSFSILNKRTLSTCHASREDTLALLSNGNLVSSSVKSIKVFDLSNYQCIKELDGNFYKSILLLPNEKLLIASYDKFLILNIKSNFEFDTITLKKRIHELDNLFLISNNHIACTGAIESEKYIFIFDNDFNCIEELKQKKFIAPTPFANLNKGKFAYGSDGNVKICDINNNYNEHSNIEVEKEFDIFTLLSINKFNLLISGTLFDLRVWETNTFQCLYTIKIRDGHVTKLLSMPNGFVAVEFNSGEIRILDALRNKVINTLKGHSGKILSLALTKDNRLISKCSYYDIIVWCY
jgi:WD40 repeat protein